MITESRLSDLRAQRDAIAAEEARKKAAADQERIRRIEAAQTLGASLASEHLTFPEVVQLGKLGDRWVLARYHRDTLIPRQSDLQPLVEEWLPGGIRSVEEARAVSAGANKVLSLVVDK